MLRAGLAGKGQQGKASKLLPKTTGCLNEELLPSRMPVPTECCNALIVGNRVSKVVGDLTSAAKTARQVQANKAMLSSWLTDRVQVCCDIDCS